MSPLRELGFRAILVNLYNYKKRKTQEKHRPHTRTQQTLIGERGTFDTVQVGVDSLRLGTKRTKLWGEPKKDRKINATTQKREKDTFCAYLVRNEMSCQ